MGRGFAGRKWFLADAGSHPFLCMSDDGGDAGGGGGGAEDGPTLESLQADLEKLKSTKDQAVAERKADQQELKSVKAKLAEFEKKEAEAQEAEAIKRGEYEKIIAGKDEEISSTRGELIKLRKDNALKDGLSTVEIAPAGKASVEAMFRDRVELDDTGKATIEGKSPGEFFKEWATTDEGKFFVTSKAAGGGAPGGTGGKPSTGNWGGSKEDRKAAIAAKFPNLK